MRPNSNTEPEEAGLLHNTQETSSELFSASGNPRDSVDMATFSLSDEDDFSDAADLSDVNDLDPEYDPALLEDDELNVGDSTNNNVSRGQNRPQNSRPSGRVESPVLPYPSINAVEGSSSQIPARNSTMDLELQLPETQPPQPLTYQQRLVNVVLSIFPIRQTYDRLSNGISTGRLQANTPGRFIGLGTDGVFRNLAAKPDRELDILNREQHPPTYEEAAADAAPEYWEVGVVNPVFEDEVFVRGLPVGTIGILFWNVMMTVAFKMVAFVLCYLLHTSHAAKEGTRVGFGAMLIMYGYSILPTNFGSPDRIPPRFLPENANNIVVRSLAMKIAGDLSTYVLDISGPVHKALSTFMSSHEPYVAYGVIAFGLFTIILAFNNFYQVKQDEQRMLAPPPQQVQHSNTEAISVVPE